MKQGFGTELKSMKHIYIDMPGFGKSSNEYVLTTIDYAHIMKIFLNKLDINPNDVTIAGHSFGGKVATALIPKTLILLMNVVNIYLILGQIGHKIIYYLLQLVNFLTLLMVLEL